MIHLIKAVFPGMLLSWLVSTVVGAHGGNGGLLNIQHFHFHGSDFAASWTLFVIGTSLGWALLKMMD